MAFLTPGFEREYGSMGKGPGLSPTNSSKMAMAMKPTMHGWVFALMALWSSRGASLEGATLNCDLSQYRPQPGLEALVEKDSLTVLWNGEQGQELRAQFSVADGTPTVRELAVRSQNGSWKPLGRNLEPQFGVTTGIRRTGHGL